MENEIIINWVAYVKKEDNQKKQSKRSNGIWYYDIRGNIYSDEAMPPDAFKPFCYPTEAEAIKARDKQLALYRIKEYCNDKRVEFVPDWNDHKQYKYHITYDNEDHKYTYDSMIFVCDFIVKFPMQTYINIRLIQCIVHDNRLYTMISIIALNYIQDIVNLFVYLKKWI